jgi:hypothetical protein
MIERIALTAIFAATSLGAFAIGAPPQIFALLAIVPILIFCDVI